MSPKYNKYISEDKFKITPSHIFYGIFALCFVIFLAYSYIEDSLPRNQYLKDVNITTATIAETATEDGKFYVRVDAGGIGNPDDMWIEVTSDFYYSTISSFGSSIGVMLGNYDVYKKKYWGLFGSGQNFELNYWGVEEIYPSYQDALDANPHKTYVETVTVTKKKTTKKGDNFLVLKKGDKSFVSPVTKESYDRYEVNDSVKCNFDAYGDFEKLTSIVE